MNDDIYLVDKMAACCLLPRKLITQNSVACPTFISLLPVSVLLRSTLFISYRKDGKEICEKEPVAI